MRTSPAVQNEVRTNQLPFPFNLRQFLIVWNWMFLDKGEYRPDPAKPAEWNRGAYLVEGLGHCQACHTAKNMLGGLKNDKAFQGGVFAQWFAPDLTGNRRVGLGGWNDAALRDFLRRGLNNHSAASGEMGEVVAFSTSRMSDEDLNAVVSYLRGIPPSPDVEPKTADSNMMKAGGAIWQDSCSACHRADGSGVPGYFPPLKANPNVQQSDPTTLIHFILAGTRKVPTDGAPTPLSMPAYHWKLSDAQVAAVATYVRNSWGNRAEPVQPDAIEEVRKKLDLHALPAARRSPANLANAGPETLGKADTDSRQNGTAQAGQPAPGNLRIETTAGHPASGTGGGASGGSGGSGSPKQQGGGHPAGVPTTGPG
jgi:mono/diheme cytochrome c family protein